MQKIITRSNGTVRVQTINVDDSLTQQQFKEQCDVNHIIAKYKHTGQIFHLAKQKGVYADVSQITDYHSMLNKINDAKAAFAALPSHLRIRFDNDPQQLLAFLQDPKNYDEGVKLGILNPKTDELANKNDLNDITSKASSKKPKPDAQPKTIPKPEPDEE